MLSGVFHYFCTQNLNAINMTDLTLILTVALAAAFILVMAGLLHDKFEQAAKQRTTNH